MIFNIKPRCECGSVKKITAQYCDACWAKLPRTLRSEFTQHAEKLKNTVICCASALKAQGRIGR